MSEPEVPYIKCLATISRRVSEIGLEDFKQIREKRRAERGDGDVNPARAPLMIIRFAPSASSIAIKYKSPCLEEQKIGVGKTGASYGCKLLCSQPNPP